MIMRLEQIILRELVFDERYTRKVLPFIKKEYFQDNVERTLFEQIGNFVEKYNTLPSTEALELGIKATNASAEQLDKTIELIQKLRREYTDIGSGMLQRPNMDWLLDNTEKFCQEKAVYNAVLESIQILDGKSKTLDKGAIPKILSDSLAVGFDTNVGHDYIEDAAERYDDLHKVEARIPFDLEYFNKITNGGLKRKTLNIAMAGVNVGKTLFMCHVSAGCLSQGKNVLYITGEMSEEEIALRHDANLLNVAMDDLERLPKDMYEKKVEKVRSMTVGKLIIKEYPTATASTANFRHLLHELNLKKNFVPDIIFVDYLNIFCSTRFKAGTNVNSYTYVKAIAEELRGLAVEFNLPIVSATQTTRSGFTSSDPGLEDTSESFGLPATADLMFALISSEDLEALGQIMVKQLKSRYKNKSNFKRFVVGIDYDKMRLYDVEQNAQAGIADAGKPDKPLNTFGNKPNKAKFGELKVT
jgi:replicative DNA helicase